MDSFESGRGKPGGTQDVLEYVLANIGKKPDPKPVNRIKKVVLPVSEGLRVPTAFASVVKYYRNNPGHSISAARYRWLYDRLAPNTENYNAFRDAVLAIDIGFEAFVCDALVNGRKESPVTAVLCKYADKVIAGIRYGMLPKELGE